MRFISLAPKLSSLKINNCYTHDGLNKSGLEVVNVDEVYNFENLKNIEFIGEYTTQQIISGLSKASEGLESLSLDKCFFEPINGSETFRLNALKKLKVALPFDTKINILSCLLPFTPNLEELAFNPGSYIKIKFDNVPIQYHLKSIYICGNTFDIGVNDSRLIRNIKNIAPNLETITISATVMSKDSEIDEYCTELDKKKYSSDQTQRSNKLVSRSMHNGSQHLVDASYTAGDDIKTMSANEIFYTRHGQAPTVKHYRLSVYNTLQINQRVCKQQKAFNLNNQGDLEFESTAHIKRSDSALFPLTPEDIREFHFFLGENAYQAEGYLSVFAFVTSD